MTASPGQLHRSLLGSLASQLKWDYGEVQLASPEHRLQSGLTKPDFVALANGQLIVGEAKFGKALTSPDTRAQLKQYRDAADGPARLMIAVPAGSRAVAETVSREAGWPDEDVTVVEVDLSDLLGPQGETPG